MGGLDANPARPAWVPFFVAVEPDPNDCLTASRYSFLFRSRVATRRSLFSGKYPSSICHVIARTSSGIPDQAADRISDMETELVCKIRLNLLILEIRVLCASAAFVDDPEGNVGWSIKCNELAGSFNNSLYCGRKILPSPFFAVGYDRGLRSSAISKLLERM